jgi:hypothetical protein
MNELIELIFNDFKVGGVTIPVSFLRYDGKATTYITYELNDMDNSLSGDDELLNYVAYYDFDIYVKKYSQINHFTIVESVRSILKQNGFIWQPSRSSGDLYEDDTGYFHTTLNFAYLREEN